MRSRFRGAMFGKVVYDAVIESNILWITLDDGTIVAIEAPGGFEVRYYTGTIAPLPHKPDPDSRTPYADTAWHSLRELARLSVREQEVVDPVVETQEQVATRLDRSLNMTARLTREMEPSQARLRELGVGWRPHSVRPFRFVCTRPKKTEEGEE